MTRPAGAVRRRYDPLKRALDICIAAVALVVTAPLQAGVAALVLTRLGRPVLFRQRRPGLHGTPFTMLKFRTMRDPDPERGVVTDAQRTTRLGAALRAASADELPGLVNVLRGDMSLVGPRPLMTAYLDRYSAQQARRHDVRPGLTGLAQVSGRNDLPWEDRFALDVHYVDHRSLLLDLQILARTVRVVVQRRGILPAGSDATAEFLGSPAAAGPCG